MLLVHIHVLQTVCIHALLIRARNHRLTLRQPYTKCCYSACTHIPPPLPFAVNVQLP
jgi:hypothetical protein